MAIKKLESEWRRPYGGYIPRDQDFTDINNVEDKGGVTLDMKVQGPFGELRQLIGAAVLGLADKDWLIFGGKRSEVEQVRTIKGANQRFGRDLGGDVVRGAVHDGFKAGRKGRGRRI